MIQELFGGGASLLGGERKISINSLVLEGSPSSSPSLSTSSSSTTTNTTSSDQQNLRCPRCDSSNTKFCYYNNYNLTQPRHFGKIKTLSSTMDIGKSNLGFDLDPPSNPILWASPQNSQLLNLLRATQNQNPNPNPNPNSVFIKEEGAMMGSYMSNDALNARPMSVDSFNQVPVNLCNSFLRNNQQHHQHSLLMGSDVQNTGIQELFQRLRSSGNYYYSDHSPSVMSNLVSTSASAATIMEPSPITASELGYWNPTFSWSNLSTTNGAFP